MDELILGVEGVVLEALIAASGVPHGQIAEALGYASPQVVTQTLRRLYLKIRDDLDIGPEDLLFSPRI